MRIYRHSYGYRYFEETIYYQEGDRRPEIRDVTKKNNAEWVLITMSRRYDDGSEVVLEKGIKLELRWAHKKDYEKLYKPLGNWV